jgi:hypothetical protein
MMGYEHLLPCWAFLSNGIKAFIKTGFDKNRRSVSRALNIALSHFSWLGFPEFDAVRSNEERPNSDVQNDSRYRKKIHGVVSRLSSGMRVRRAPALDCLPVGLLDACPVLRFAPLFFPPRLSEGVQ